MNFNNDGEDLANGQYDERKNRQDFVDAVAEWRKSSKTTGAQQNADARQTQSRESLSSRERKTVRFADNQGQV